MAYKQKGFPMHSTKSVLKQSIEDKIVDAYDRIVDPYAKRGIRKKVEKLKEVVKPK